MLGNYCIIRVLNMILLLWFVGTFRFILVVFRGGRFDGDVVRGRARSKGGGGRGGRV